MANVAIVAVVTEGTLPPLFCCAIKFWTSHKAFV